MEFVLVIIEVLACFTAGFFLLKPEIRKAFPTAIFGTLFYFEGLWSMLNYIIGNIWPANHVMDIIKYIFTLIITVFIIVIMMNLSKRVKKHQPKSRSSQNQNRKSNLPRNKSNKRPSPVDDEIRPLEDDIYL